MLSKELIKFSNEISSKIYFDYDLKKSNWFNIGGKTKIYFKPDNLPDLILFLKKFGNKERIHILGAGSNTLISDQTFDGAVIKLGFIYKDFAKDIIKKSKVKLFMVNDEYELAKLIKNTIYGKKIVIGMGAGTISAWMRQLPSLI